MAKFKYADIPNMNLISEYGEVGISMEQFSKFIDYFKENDIDPTQYSIISIMGGQSGGKSTLLNLLFGTNFKILPPKERHSTTKGIWISIANYPKNLLVMDLEGTDSDDRNEAASETFARKCSLFALALAEILIVNIWAHDVGKKSATNLLILKTVFEVNIQMFKGLQHNKTKILFIFRDHDEHGPCPYTVLKSVMEKSLTKIWNSIEKPNDMKETNYNDLFETEFVGLANKFHSSHEFKRNVAVLKKRLSLNPASKDTLWNPKTIYSKSKDVPLEAFLPYCERIWNSIKVCEDLNILSQKVALTNIICQKYLDVSLEYLNKKIITLEKSNTFGKDINFIYKTTIKKYDDKIYNNERIKDDYKSELGLIRHNKRNKLQNSALSILESIYQKRMRVVMKNCYEMFEMLMLEELKKKIKKFKNAKTECKKEVIDNFNKICEESSIIGVKWNNENIILELMMNIKRITKKLKEKEIRYLDKEIEENINNMIEKKIEKILEHIDMKFWKNISDFKNSIQNEMFIEVERKYNEYAINTEKIKAAQLRMNNIVLDKIHWEIKNKFKYLEHILKKKFENEFELDQNGIPIQWNLVKDIREKWVLSKEKIFKMLKELSVGEILDENGIVCKKIIIIKEKEQLIIKNKLNDMMIRALKRVESKKNSSRYKIPLWLIFLIIILGLDEFIWVLRNPLIMIILLFGIVFVFVIRNSNNLLVKYAINKLKQNILRLNGSDQIEESDIKQKKIN